MWNIVSVIARVKPETKLIIILSYTSHRLQRNAKGPEVNSINEFEFFFHSIIGFLDIGYLIYYIHYKWLG